jgi:hypothetical protein
LSLCSSYLPLGVPNWAVSTAIKVIDYSLSVEEFETKWAEMLVKHDIVENKHFFDIYDLRESALF